MWRRGGLLVGSGLVAGLVIVVWLRLYTEAPVVNSSGGSVALDTGGQTPTGAPLQPSPTPGLQVVDPSAASPTPAAAPAPSPTDFKQYEQYRTNQSAMFGEITVGQGKTLAVGGTAVVSYRGWLTDGTLFDETPAGKYFSFREGDHRVIAGWEEGLLGMKVGGKRRLIVPPAAGYGAAAQGPIPANSVLVFDVELLDVQ